MATLHTYEEFQTLSRANTIADRQFLAAILAGGMAGNEKAFRHARLTLNTADRLAAFLDNVAELAKETADEIRGADTGLGLDD